MEKGIVHSYPTREIMKRNLGERGLQGKKEHLEGTTPVY